MKTWENDIAEKLIKKFNLKFLPFKEKMNISPGMILKIDTGEIFLVGNINPVFGICDDCKDFSRDNIVEYINLERFI